MRLHYIIIYHIFLTDVSIFSCRNTANLPIVRFILSYLIQFYLICGAFRSDLTGKLLDCFMAQRDSTPQHKRNIMFFSPKFHSAADSGDRHRAKIANSKYFSAIVWRYQNMSDGDKLLLNDSVSFSQGISPIVFCSWFVSFFCPPYFIQKPWIPWKALYKSKL